MTTVPPPVDVAPMAPPPSTLSADPGLEALRYLASQCPTRRLIHDLTMADVHLWDGMTERERRLAFERAVRRVGAVAPWVTTKGRVVDAAESMGRRRS